jgi:hypothetical protein
MTRADALALLTRLDQARNGEIDCDDVDVVMVPILDQLPTIIAVLSATNNGGGISDLVDDARQAMQVIISASEYVCDPRTRELDVSGSVSSIQRNIERLDKALVAQTAQVTTLRRRAESAEALNVTLDAVGEAAVGEAAQFRVVAAEAHRHLGLVIGEAFAKVPSEMLSEAAGAHLALEIALKSAAERETP